MSTLATLVVKLVGDVSGFRSDMESAGETVRNVGRNIGDAGGDLTRNLTVPIVGAGTAAVLMGNQFNEGMANVVSLVPEASTEIAGMSDDVQQLAVDMGQSTSDMTAGLYQQISATGYGADSLELLRVNATAAAAGLSTTREAIDLTSAVTRGYGDTTVEATQKASDLALKTVQMGQTTFPELASSIGRVVPLAAQLGVSQEELFGVMATGAGVTGTASEVATQFRGVLQSMMAPTEAMQGAFEELHVANAQQLLDTYGLEDGLTNVMNIAAASGQPLQSYIGSIEGQTLALSLVGPQAEDWVTKTEAMRGAAGTAQAAFEAQTTGVNEAGFAMQQAAIQTQVMGQNIGQALGPAIMTIIPYVLQFLGWIQGLVQRFTELDPKTQTIILGAIGLAAAIGPILMVLGPIVTGFGALVTVLGAILSPIGLVVLAIAGLVALAAAIILHWDEVKTFLSNLWETVRQAIVTKIEEIRLAISTWLTGIQNFFATFDLGAAAGSLFDKVKQGIATKITEIASAVVGWLDNTLVAIESFDLKEAAKTFFGTTLPGIAEKAGQALQDVATWLSTTATNISNSTLVENAKTWFGTVVPGIAEKTSKALQDVATWLSTTATNISTFDLKEAAKTLFGTTLPGIAEKLGAGLTDVGTWLGNVATRIREHTFKSDTLTTFQTVIVGILEKASEIYTKVGEMLTTIAQKIREFDLREVGQNLIQGLIDGVRSMAQSLVDAARGVVQSAIDAAKNLLGLSGGGHSASAAANGVFFDIGQRVMQDMGLGIHSGSGDAADALREALQTIIELADELPDDLAAKFEGFAGIADAIKLMVRGPAGDVRPVIDAWKTQILYVIRMLSQVWQNWQDPNVLLNAGQAAEVVGKVFEPWETVKKAIDTIVAGPGGDVRPKLESWKQQVLWTIRMLSQIWQNWDDKTVFENAQAAAEAIGAVVKPWEDLKKALDVIIAGPGADITAQLKVWEIRVVDLVRSLARMAAVIGQSAAAANMAEIVAEIASAVRDAMDDLSELGGVSLEDIATVTGQAGETWINGFMAGIRLRLPMLWELIINVRGLLGQIDTLTPGIVMGRNWIDGIIVGIQQGLPLLTQAAAAAMAGISKPGAGGGPDGGPEMASAGGNQVTVNMYGPWNVRDQGDIEAIAQRVAEVLGQRSAAVRRVTV